MLFSGGCKGNDSFRAVTGRLRNTQKAFFPSERLKATAIFDARKCREFVLYPREIREIPNKDPFKAVFSGAVWF